MSFVQPTPRGSSPICGEEVERILRARRLRSRYLGTDLFADPAWDMLLQAFACHLKHIRISVSSLSQASGVPLTTGLRWLAKLEADNLLEREEDPFDTRRNWVKLSDSAATMLRRYFDEVERDSLPGL